jgi:hypothetical protein
MSPLADLPDDLVEHMCRFLSHLDLTRLLLAYTGTVAITHRRDLAWLPVHVRDAWVARAAYEHVRHAVVQYSERARLFIDHNSWMAVHVFADWSAFASPNAPSSTPLAQFRWTVQEGLHRWSPVVDDAALLRLVHRLMLHGRCAFRLTAHCVVSTVVVYDELHAQGVCAFPHTML